MKNLVAAFGFVSLFWASLFNRANDDIIKSSEIAEAEPMAATKKPKKVKNTMGVKPTVKPRQKKRVR